MKRKLLYLVRVVIGLALLFGVSMLASAEDFYKGKTLRFIVGYSPGGGYDAYTRTIARHISKYIPGNPTVIVQNMTGAGSLIAAHYLNKRAKADGLAVGVWNNNAVLNKALGDASVKFDPTKTVWIGAPSIGLPTCSVMGFAGVRTLEDIKNSKKPIKMGGTRGSMLSDLPKIMNKTLGTKLEVIPGYRGTAPIRIALQKGEVDGVCFGWESKRVTARSMLDAEGDNKLIPFLIEGNSQDPEVKDLPQFSEVIKGKDNRAMFNAWVQMYKFQRPLSLPPGTPRERVEILRKAFKAALEDPELLAEAKKSNVLIDYVSGEQIEKYVEQIMAIPPEVKEKLLDFIVIKKKK